MDVPPAPSGPTVAAALGRVVGARSGDKGGTANLGVFARSAEAYAWLAGFLTVERLRTLMPAETEGLEVRRYELPNLWALNFLIVGLLEEGVAGSSRMDGQAKSLGEYLRAKVVDVPEVLVPGVTTVARRVARWDGLMVSGGNLFATIRAAAPAPSSALAELPDGTVVTYGDAFALAARFAHVLRARRGRAGRPGRRPGRQVVARGRALPRLPAGGGRLPAPQPGLHAG